MTTFTITQGATRTVKITNIVDGDEAPLDVTSWSVHAVARENGVPGPVVAEWVSGNPGPGQGQATPIGSEVHLEITPEMSSAWTWDIAALQVEVTESGPSGRVERLVGTSERPVWLVLDHEAVI